MEADRILIEVRRTVAKRLQETSGLVERIQSLVYSIAGSSNFQLLKDPVALSNKSVSINNFKIS